MTRPWPVKVGFSRYLPVDQGTAASSAAPKSFVEVDDLRALLEAEIDREIGSLATAERDRLLDMVGAPAHFCSVSKTMRTANGVLLRIV
jgi:hypothetical protein